MLGFPHAISQAPRRDNPDDLAFLRRCTDLTTEADTSDLSLELAFAVTDSGRDRGDRLSGVSGGNWATVECVGAVLSDHDDVALTRDQVMALLGADHVAEAERRAAEKYADGMRG